ncbi:hypothetical protein IQ07DRAFT_17259 [Pyrenochaeta sp. DS3sAY3a]|nr:hypothetical protein IQ07DRAFT_17259 [Pyrenochaeta sp. DS3sAY3a]
MKRRTYSQRGKHQSTYQSQKLPSPEPSNKRRKTNKSAVSQPPPTPPPSRGGPKDELSTAGLEQFNDPVSVPSEHIADEGTAEQVAEKSVLDKALVKKPTASRPVQPPSIYGSREEFLTAIKKRKAASQSAPESTKPLLPTLSSDTPEDQSPALCADTPTQEPTRKKQCLPPPPEVEQTATPPTDTPEDPSPASCANTPTPEDQSPAVCANKPTPEPTQKKICLPPPPEVEKTAAPRETILGHRLSKRSEEAKTWAKNQETSPFLRLPEGVRNRIYELALGGKTINIDFETYRDVRDGAKVQDTVPVFKYHSVVYDDTINPYMKKFKRANVKATKGLTLLNNVCRQMYVETATLPYKLNLLSFGSYNTMFNFLAMERRLNRKQLDAITKIVLPDGLPATNILKHLRNLERVYIGVERPKLAKGWRYVVRREGEQPTYE